MSAEILAEINKSPLYGEWNKYLADRLSPWGLTIKTTHDPINASFTFKVVGGYHNPVLDNDVYLRMTFPSDILDEASESQVKVSIGGSELDQANLLAQATVMALIPTHPKVVLSAMDGVKAEDHPEYLGSIKAEYEDMALDWISRRPMD